MVERERAKSGPRRSAGVVWSPRTGEMKANACRGKKSRKKWAASRFRSGHRDIRGSRALTTQGFLDVAARRLGSATVWRSPFSRDDRYQRRRGTAFIRWELRTSGGRRRAPGPLSGYRPLVSSTIFVPRAPARSCAQQRLGTIESSSSMSTGTMLDARDSEACGGAGKGEGAALPGHRLGAPS